MHEKASSAGKFLDSKESERLLMEGLAYVTGNVVDLSRASIPLTDRGFLFGQAVFETLRITRETPENFAGHFMRLQNSCQLACITPPPSETAETAVHVLSSAFIAKYPNRDGLIRLIVTGGVSPHLRDLNCDPRIYAYVIPLAKDLGKPQSQERGVKLLSLLDQRPRELLEAKTSNYVHAIRALHEAKRQGFDDVLFINKNDEITEATTATFVWADSRGQLNTAPSEGNCLPGTTVQALGQILSKPGEEILFLALKRHHIRELCSAAVLLSSVQRARPVLRIDDVELPGLGSHQLASKINHLLEHFLAGANKCV